MLLVQEYSENHTGVEQIVLYPQCVNDQYIDKVQKLFTEYNGQNELPLLFYIDDLGTNDCSQWIMITNYRLFYSLVYYPNNFKVLNSVSLSKIKDIQIKKKLWINDTYIKINGKKIGTIEILDKRVPKILLDIIKIAISCNKDNTIEENLSKSEDDPGNLENECLLTIAKQYFEEVNLGGKYWAFECFYYGPFIPEDKLREASENYAPYSEQERPIIYIDNSWIGHIKDIDKSGVVITNKNLYYKLMRSKNSFKLLTGKFLMKDITSFRIKSGFTGWMYINKTKLNLTRFMIWDRKEAKVVESLMILFIKELHRRV